MAQKIVIDSGKLLNSSYDKIKLTLFKRINRMKLSASNKMLDRELNSFEKILEREILNSTRELAKNTYEYIKKLASQELEGTKDLYISNLIYPQEISPGLHIIILRDGADFIETGLGFDMKPGLLKNAERSEKTGFNYKVIPFKHNQNSPSASAHAKEVSKKIRSELRKKKIPIKKLEMTKTSGGRKKSPREVPKTGRVAQLNFIEENNKKTGRTLHKISVYQNVIDKAKRVTPKNISRDIFTFRTVTDDPKQADKWLYPDKKGKMFFEKAEKFVLKEWENKIGRAHV